MKRNKFAAVSTIATFALLLTNCTGVPASATQLNNEQQQKTIEKVVEVKKSDILVMTQSMIKIAKIEQNTKTMESTVEKLKKRVNKTWYVFGGATTSGWDCSGLVLWFYKHFGIKLYHGAYSQKHSAKPHKYVASKVKPGDIIACYGPVGTHVGIASDRSGYMIHAPRPGVSTKEDKVLDLFSSCTYTRLITTN